MALHLFDVIGVEKLIGLRAAFILGAQVAGITRTLVSLHHLGMATAVSTQFSSKHAI